MGRPRKFCRNDVLERALPLFWSRGYAHTGVQDLEKITGVNKSGLYAEFEGKEEIFLESLRHYFDNSPLVAVLSVQPLGWANVESLLRTVSVACAAEQRGCFAVSSLRELPQLPSAAQELVASHRARLKELMRKNIAAEKTRLSAEEISEVAATLYSGFCIELHLKSSKAALQQRIDNLIQALKSL